MNPSRQTGKFPRPWITILAAVSLAAVAMSSLRMAPTSAQEMPSIVGRIEGDDLEVATTTPAGVETHNAPTVVASGSEVTLHSGRALLMLNTGGAISVCGPARFRMVKSGEAVTLALDYGRVHPELQSSELFTVYTPSIVATPITISGESRDLTVGLEQSGEMCVITKRGAMRVESQFSDQTMIIPQGGVATLNEGKIESVSNNGFGCGCEFPRAGSERAPRSVRPPREFSTMSHPAPPEKNAAETPPAAAADQPVYTVLMPPLKYDANSPMPPPTPDPETLILVRDARVRSSAVFRGHVNPAPQAELAPAPAMAAVPLAKPADAPAAAPQISFMDRVRNFFHRLMSAVPCTGRGCAIKA